MDYATKSPGVWFPEEQNENSALLRLLRAVLRNDLHQCRSEGENVSIETRIARLSRRERQVMRLVFMGRSTKSIATQLGITLQTVAKHRARVLKKMELRSSVDVARVLSIFAFGTDDASWLQKKKLAELSRNVNCA